MEAAAPLTDYNRLVEWAAANSVAVSTDSRTST